MQIDIGEEFTIGIQIENCGSKIPEFVQFELINPPTDIEIKESLVIEIPRLNYANSERFITYHMRIAENASPGNYLIKTRLTYGEKDSLTVENDNISFLVRGEKAELNLASVKVNPVLPTEKETVELTMRIENTGRGAAKSIVVYAEHPFQGTKQAFIGSLNSNEEGPAIFTFIADKSGTFNIACSMNMYRGTFVVLESDGTKSDYVEEKSSASGGCGMGGGCGGCGGF